MFNKEEFSNILKKIYNTYNNQRDFALATGVNRGYLSQYLNMKLDSPPSPKILMKIALASNSVTTYEELMNICGFLLYGENKLADIEKASKILAYDNMIREKDLSVDEQNIVNKLNQLYDDYYDKGLTIQESEFEALSFLKRLNLSKYEQKKMKEYLEIYILSKASNRVIQQIYKNKSEIDLKYNYIYLTNKLKSLMADMNEKYVFKEENTVMVPILKKINVGNLFSKKNIENYIYIDANIYDINIKDCCFCLMQSENDYILVKKQDWAENNDIIILNDEEINMKKYKKLNNKFVFLENTGLNNLMENEVIDLREREIEIVGKVIGKFNKF